MVDLAASHLVLNLDKVAAIWSFEHVGILLSHLGMHKLRMRQKSLDSNSSKVEIVES